MIENLLWIGDSPNLRGGFGRVTREFCNHLEEMYFFKYDITVFGIKSSEEINTQNKYRYNVINSFDCETGTLGLHKLLKIIDVIHPKKIIIHNTPLIISQYAAIIKSHILDVEIYGYFVIEKELSGSDIPIIMILNTYLKGGFSMTPFGFDQLIKYGFNKRLCILPIGFNIDSFTSYTPKEAKYFLGLDDTFVFFYGGKNKKNNNLDILLEGYANFLSNHLNDKIVLLMNCNPYEYYNIPDLFKEKCQKLNILEWEKYIKFTINESQTPKFNDDELSLFYAASDIGISLSKEHSWGQTVFEHAGFKKPQIINDNTPISQILMNGVIKINNTVNELTNALEKYYSDKEMRDKDSLLLNNDINKFKWDRVIYRFLKHII
jgi:glycosyltransferase involved in cell wall biosynthesis